MKGDNLFKEDKRILFDRLGNYINENRSEIKNFVSYFQNSGKKFSLHEFSSELIGVIGKGRGAKKVSIGFPFPVASKELGPGGIKIQGNCSVNFFIRGAELRRCQKKMLEKHLSLLQRESRYTVIKEKKEFRKLTKKYIEGRKSVIYVDPYNNPNETHIGNSIIGLHFLDSFDSNFMFDKIVILSNSANHLQSFYESYFKTSQNFQLLAEKADIVILPSVVDFRWGEILEEISFFCKKKKIIFLVARNIIIDATNEKIELFSYRDEDVLLINKNVEDYMDDCLDPFLGKKASYSIKKIKNPKLNVFFINPFSASELKDISVEMVIDVIEEIINRCGKNCVFHISKGVKTSSKDNNWVKEFRRKLSRRPSTHMAISFCPFFRDLTELLEFLQEKRVFVALTSDTAVSHLLTRSKIPNITFFDIRFWDVESTQSICTLFCRYYPWQIPAVYDYSINKGEYARSIAEGLIFLQLSKNEISTHFSRVYRVKKIREIIRKIGAEISHRSSENTFWLLLKQIDLLYLSGISRIPKNVAWTTKIYDPHCLYNGIFGKEGFQPLAYAAWRLMPLNKLSSL